MDQWLVHWSSTRCPSCARSVETGPSSSGWCVPDAVLRTRAILAPARAWVCLSSGDLLGAEAWLDVGEGLGGPGRPTGRTTASPRRSSTLGQRRTAPANGASTGGHRTSVRRHAAATIEYASRAQALAEPDDHLVRGAAAGFLGLASWAHLGAALGTFRGAVAHLRGGRAGHVTDQLGATVALASMALALGDARALAPVRGRTVRAGQPAGRVPVTGDLQARERRANRANWTGRGDRAQPSTSGREPSC